MNIYCNVPITHCSPNINLNLLSYRLSSCFSNTSYATSPNLLQPSSECRLKIEETQTLMVPTLENVFLLMLALMVALYHCWHCQLIGKPRRISVHDRPRSLSYRTYRIVDRRISSLLALPLHQKTRRLSVHSRQRARESIVKELWRRRWKRT